jgi:hypothetical protein
MDTHSDALAEAKDAAQAVWGRQYPAGLTVAPAWAAHQRQNRSRIAAFTSSAAAIAFAQNGSETGFDHRIEVSRFAEQVCAWKLREITQAFDWPEWATESTLSSSIDIQGKRLSTIFLTHLYYYLRIVSLEPKLRTIVEIGGGYGGLARIFKMGRPDCRYVLIDLPESLFFAHVFLRENFPQSKIAYGAPAAGGGFDFLLLPVQNAEALSSVGQIDVAINTGSFQEMTEDANRYWMGLLQNRADVRALYSFNYFLLNRERHGETAGGATPICPILDDRWTPAFFKINPPIPTIDATQRNWLELFVRRAAPGRAEDHAVRAAQFPAATDGWFESALLAFWCGQKAEHAAALLNGISIFKSGASFGIPNYRQNAAFSETPFGRWFIGNLNYVRGRQAPSDYIDIKTGRYVGSDVGFMRHNYYFLRHLRKTVGRRTSRADISAYSEEQFLRRFL